MYGLFVVWVVCLYTYESKRLKRLYFGLYGYVYILPLFAILLPFFGICDFSVGGQLKRSASFLGFSIRGVCAYVKLLQGLGVCVGCELLQANVKKYHGKGCVSYPICCSHRGYVGTLNCCKEKGHRFYCDALVLTKHMVVY